MGAASVPGTPVNGTIHALWGFCSYHRRHGGRAHRTARCSPRRSPAPRWYMLYFRRYCRLPLRHGLPRYIARVYGAHHPQMGEDRTPTAAATGTSIIGCRARPWGSRARIFQGSDRTRCTIVRAAARRPPGDTGGGVRARRRRGDGGTGSDACPGALPLCAAERHAVWKSTNELGYNCGQRRVDGVEAPRHRADAVMGTTSCRWCGASEIFDLTQVARRCVLGQAETQEASATPDARPSTARGDGVPVGSRAVLRATHGAHLPNAILPLDDGVTSMTSVERRRGARTVPKSIKKPPTTSSDGHELRRWREGTAAPRDAVIMMRY
jgi:hypothetical protein